MKLRWLLVLIPLGAGGLVAWAVGMGWLPDRTLHAWFDIAALAIAAGAFLSMVLALLVWNADILRRRHLQELANLQKETALEHERFLQRLDHEVKNPLTSILSNVSQLLNRVQEPTDQEKLASAREQALRIRHLTADLRKLYQLKEIALEQDVVDVNALLRQAAATVQDLPAADERHLTLMLPQAPWPLPFIRGDRALLLDAICNLIDNAVKFTRPGDTIEVRAAEDAGMVKIEIADTGPGIPAEDLPHLGKDLYRGQNAATIPGSGLGLALAKIICSRHGGDLALDSRLGAGTIVTIRLPVAASPTAVQGGAREA